MRRGLSQDIEHPKMLVAFSIRPFESGDAAMLFDANSRADQAERWKLENRIQRGLKGCYVAVLEDGRATYIQRSEEHTSELQSLMRLSYAVFCLNKKNIINA